MTEHKLKIGKEWYNFTDTFPYLATNEVFDNDYINRLLKTYNARSISLIDNFLFFESEEDKLFFVLKFS